MERKKTYSKNYFDDEIQAVLNDGTLILKKGVYKNPKRNFTIKSEDNDGTIINIDNSYIMRDKMNKIKEEDNDWN